MLFLAIETSCDETAIAVIDENKNIILEELISQIDLHKYYGGIVPEISSRNHLLSLHIIAKNVFSRVDKKDIGCIIVTQGPGLIGSLITGVMVAKAMSSYLNIPIIGVNHLEGHIFSADILNNDIEVPFLSMLLSGGHCQVLIVEGVGKYNKIGETLDDAAGELLDKVAKMLGLPYPGGPIIEKLSLSGDENRFSFTKPMANRKDCNFSYSGLKTNINLFLQKFRSENSLNSQDVSDICASVQKTVVETIIVRLERAFAIFKEYHPNQERNILTLVGGVAANKYFRHKIEEVCSKNDFHLFMPPQQYCTDNAVMIANIGLKYYNLGKFSDLDFSPYSRTPA